MSTAIRYYRACEGRWSAPLQLRVTDPRALSRVLGWLDALGFRLLARLPGLRISTTVVVRSDTLVEHTTRVHWGPLVAMASEERLALDGAAVRMSGGSRTLLGARDPIRGEATASDDAMRVDYAMEWLGMAITQVGQRLGDDVVLEQDGPGFHSRVRLVRQEP